MHYEIIKYVSLEASLQIRSDGISAQKKTFLIYTTQIKNKVYYPLKFN